MGGTASKVSRKLPSKPAASLTGARTDAIANTSRPGGSVNSKILASETKNSCEALCLFSKMISSLII